MSGIRVGTGVKRIEVNDAGEYIELNFADQALPGRFYHMLDKCQQIAAQADADAQAIHEKYAGSPTEEQRALLEYNETIHRAMMTELDAVFGKDTCRKVFGDIIPGLDLIADFLEQLQPFMEQGMAERTAKMQKYSAPKTGSTQ